eukprot:jgi/Mesvir1/11951/Mv00279-RA.1
MHAAAQLQIKPCVSARERSLKYSAAPASTSQQCRRAGQALSVRFLTVRRQPTICLAYKEQLDDSAISFEDLADADPEVPPLATQESVRQRRFDVDHNFIGMRLDTFISTRIRRMSRTLAKAAVAAGNVTVLPQGRGSPRPSLRLQLGDVVTVRETLAPERVQDDEVSILYRDDDVLVLLKPAGMLVHATASAVSNTITAYLHRRGMEEAEPVHRLDLETSGVLVCAARREMVPTLRTMFAKRNPRKLYRTLVADPEERWAPGQLTTLDTPLGPTATPPRMGKGTLRAVSHVKVMGHYHHHELGRVADLAISIETGRAHQIRAHVSLYGTPVLGDKLYYFNDGLKYFKSIKNNPGDPELLRQLGGYDRQMLHAWKVAFPHPRDAVERRFRYTEDCASISVEAPLPESWFDGLVAL